MNAALQTYQLTYAPAYRPSGTPLEPTASRQTLAERKTANVEAITSDGAIDTFERDAGRMVTGCKRLQPTPPTSMEAT